MLNFVTGDLFKADVDCLVNTVNCEGYMGKGIAYQFKVQYPENNLSYVKACKSGNLTPGKLHVFRERGKTIVNFPTKDKWRAKSRIEYIHSGLDELVKVLPSLEVSSLAIPPLGSGNGGLNWSEVRAIVHDKLEPLSNHYDFLVYEPSKHYEIKPVEAPPLSASSLVLMNIKLKLKKFDKLRLQKAAFMTNYFAGQEYFHFEKYKLGPYDNAIDIISKNIKQYQMYYHINTAEAYSLAYRQLISDSLNEKMQTLWPAIARATDFVNNIKSDDMLECVTTVLYIIKEAEDLSKSDIIRRFIEWNERKASHFSENDVLRAMELLENEGIIQNTILGYRTVVPCRERVI
jgi:O-acetyl-ADP-ribose deacetylase (regulator of RNase III)